MRLLPFRRPTRHAARPDAPPSRRERAAARAIMSLPEHERSSAVNDLAGMYDRENRDYWDAEGNETLQFWARDLGVFMDTCPCETSDDLYANPDPSKQRLVLAHLAAQGVEVPADETARHQVVVAAWQRVVSREKMRYAEELATGMVAVA